MDDDHSDSISPAELQEFLGPQQAGTPSAADIVRVGDISGDGLADLGFRRGSFEVSVIFGQSSFPSDLDRVHRLAMTVTRLAAST